MVIIVGEGMVEFVFVVIWVIGIFGVILKVRNIFIENNI